MMKVQKTPWITYLKQSAIEALAAMLLFWVIYAGHQTEIVRSLAGDTAFTTLNSFFSGEDLDDENHTKIQVYMIDHTYLENENMLDEYNNTNYGDSFPRSKLAAFIKTVDALETDKQPISLFIDYLMVDGTASFDMKESILHISKDDMVFLNQLAVDRNYSVLLPKTEMRNFVEQYAEESNSTAARKIKAQIERGVIIFVGVNTLTSDGHDYRYNPMSIYENKDKIYYNVALVNWQLSKKKENKDINESQISALYDPKVFTNVTKVLKEGEAIFKSNIINMDTVGSTNTLYPDIRTSKWGNLSFSSAKRLDENVSLANSLVMLGVNFANKDKHKNNLDEIVSGVQNLADATKTVLFLDGKLEHINLWLGFIIVFVIFFTVTMFSRFILPIIPRKGKVIAEFIVMLGLLCILTAIVYIKFGIGMSVFLVILGIVGMFSYYYYLNAPIWFNVAFELLLLVGIMLYVSSYILLEYKLWFNWFIPVLIFYLDDIIIVWREYYEISIKKEK